MAMAAVSVVGGKGGDKGLFLPSRSCSTGIVYTHVLNRGGQGVRSPADSLGTALELGGLC